MNARRIPILVLMLTLFLGACGAFEPDEAVPVETEERPNFLLVVADDMGYTDTGPFGGEIETPNLDRLAASGVRFADFHVSMSCSPTRAMMMSGMDNHLAGLGNMGELITPNQRGKPGYEGYLSRDVISLPEALGSGGYHTYMAGKWHLGHEPDQRPFARGFERSLALMYGGASHWNDRHGLIAAQDPVIYTRNGEKLEQLPEDFYSSKNYADFLMESIRENHGDGKPFLAYLAFTAPHDPLHVPEPWLSKYRGRYDEGYEALKASRAEGAARAGVVRAGAPLPQRHSMTPAWDTLSPEERTRQSRMMEVYAGMVDNMDHHLGRVLDFLDDIGELDNTVIIFFSDNGPNPWDSEDYPGNRDGNFMDLFDNSLDNLGKPGSNVAYGSGWAQASAGPYSYFKMTVAEGGTRSPLIVAGPQVNNGGRINDTPVTAMDVMPTLLDIAGIEHPETFNGRRVKPMMGRSMKGVAAGTAERVHPEDTLFGHQAFEEHELSGEMLGGKFVRRGDWKALFVSRPYGPNEWQLFDLAADPGETDDLAGEHRELLEELTAGWDQYANDVGVVPPEG